MRKTKKTLWVCDACKFSTYIKPHKLRCPACAYKKKYEKRNDTEFNRSLSEHEVMELYGGYDG